MRAAFVLATLAVAAAAAPFTDYTEDTTPYSTPDYIDPTASYCSCSHKNIYLDIVFITDVSGDMTQNTVGDATATIQSIMLGLTHGSNFYESNVAAIAFADSVKVVNEFGSIRSNQDVFNFDLPYLNGKASKMTEAIETASSMISANARNITRGVIVMISKSFNQLDATNIKEAAEAFTNDGGIIISIDYAQGLGIKGLEDIASEGYYINDASEKRDSLPGDVLYAFCDANCFCPNGHYPYDLPNDKGRRVPMGCYHVSDIASVYDAAEQNCIVKQNGFVATVHDNDKSFFLQGIFPSGARYWIGLKKYSDQWTWADGSTDPFTWWAASNPASGDECAYTQRLTGFNSPWYSAPCIDTIKHSMAYACQLRPCDSTYDCFI